MNHHHSGSPELKHENKNQILRDCRKESTPKEKQAQETNKSSSKTEGKGKLAQLKNITSSLLKKLQIVFRKNKKKLLK